VPVFVAVGFFGHIFLESGRQVNAGLVGDAD